MRYFGINWDCGKRTRVGLGKPLYLEKRSLKYWRKPSIDSHGNFYTIGGVNEKRAVLKNSFGFEDTFYQSKQGKYGHILTKFNRRGKKIWQTDFPVLLENESFILGV